MTSPCLQQWSQAAVLAVLREQHQLQHQLQHHLRTVVTLDWRGKQGASLCTSIDELVLGALGQVEEQVSPRLVAAVAQLVVEQHQHQQQHHVLLIQGMRDGGRSWSLGTPLMC